MNEAELNQLYQHMIEQDMPHPGRAAKGVVASGIVAGALVLGPGTAGAEEYQIQYGDTLNEIAEDYGVDPDTLATANNIEDKDLIIAGSK